MASPPASPTRRSRRPSTRLVAGLALSVAGVFALMQLRGGDPGGSGSAPASYTATYRVEDTLSDPVIIDEWVLEVQRPYRSALVQRRGDDPLGATFSQVDALTIVSGADGPSVRRPALPGVAYGDLRLDLTMDEAIADGRLTADGSDRFAGHSCRWVRSADPLDVGRWAAPVDDENVTRTCVTDDWIVAAEEITYSRRLARRRTLVAYEAAAEVDDPPAPEDAGPPPDLGGLAEVALLDAVPEAVLALIPPAAPEGFELDHIAGYRESDALGTNQMAAVGRRLVFRDGIDIVFLDERRDQSGVGSAPPQGDTVAAGPLLEDMEIVADGRGVTLRGRLDGVDITVGGTVEVQVLFDWIATFEPAG